MLELHNVNFTAFLRDKEQRQYADKTKDYSYLFFKTEYDTDCDFIHIMRTYISRNNPDGKFGLTEGSKLSGIYVYSLDLLFNIEYDLRDYLADGYIADMRNYQMPDVKEYYKQLCKDISNEVIRRVEAGLFDRNEAKKLVVDDDGDIEYYNTYRERESAERDFLEGQIYDKPKICVPYDTRCEYDIDAVLEYLRNQNGIVNARATEFMETEKAMIYKEIVRAEIHYTSLRELEDNISVLHYRREIRRIMRGADVKTVNVTFMRGDNSVTVKIEADRLGWNDTVSDYSIAAADRWAYGKIFGYKHDGDARTDEITLITHGRKELYNKAEFDGLLTTLFKAAK